MLLPFQGDNYHTAFTPAGRCPGLLACCPFGALPHNTRLCAPLNGALQTQSGTTAACCYSVTKAQDLQRFVGFVVINMKFMELTESKMSEKFCVVG